MKNQVVAVIFGLITIFSIDLPIAQAYQQSGAFGRNYSQSSCYRSRGCSSRYSRSRSYRSRSYRSQRYYQSSQPTVTWIDVTPRRSGETTSIPDRAVNNANSVRIIREAPAPSPTPVVRKAAPARTYTNNATCFT